MDVSMDVITKVTAIVHPFQYLPLPHLITLDGPILVLSFYTNCY